MKSLYAEHLANSLGAVVQQSIEHRSQLEDFLLCFKSRVAAEQSYSRDLRSIEEVLNKRLSHADVQLTSMGFLLAALRSGVSRRAVQVEDFVGHLNAQILTGLRDLFQSQSSQCKRLEKQGKTIDKQIRESEEKQRVFRQKLGSLSRVYEEEFMSLEIMKARCGYSGDQKRKQASRIFDLEKEQGQVESLYKISIREYEYLMDSRSSEISKILSAFEVQVLGRIEKTKQSLKKLMIFQTAMMRNFDYDIVNINNQVERTSPAQAVLQFVEKNKAVSQKQIMVKRQVTQNAYQMSMKTLEQNIQLQGIKEYKAYIEQNIKEPSSILPQCLDKDKGEIVRIVQMCWKNQPLGDVIVQRFNKLVEDDTNRHFFHLAFEHYNWHFTQVSGDAVTLFRVVIKKSEQSRDIYTIRKLLSITFGKWVTSNPKQLVLYRGIQTLALWKNQDFWDYALFEAIQQSLKVLTIQKGETSEETKMKEENIILSQLASYCHIMIMLGSSQKVVKTIVGKYCRVYGLGVDQNKVLSKTISETLTTYRQFN